MNKFTIPNSWMWVKLNKISQILGGGTPRRNQSEYFDGEIPWATPTDITSLSSLYLDKTKETITKKGLKNSSAKLLPIGTVLMTSRATIGKTAILEKAAATNQGFINFICDASLLSNEYLARYLFWATPLLLRISVGSTFKEISRSAIKDFEIPLPTLTEQQKIVEILKQAELLNELRDISDEKIKKLKSDLFYDFFLKDQTVLNSWEKIPLEKMATKITSGSRGWGKYYSDTGARFIRVQDISNGEINFNKPQMILPPDTAAKERSRILPKDILISIVGSSIGKIALFPNNIKEAYVSQNVAIIRIHSDYSPIYTSLYLDHLAGGKKDIFRLIYGQTQPTIGLNHLERIRIPIPPLNLIKEFQSIYKGYSKISSNAETSLNRINKLIENLNINAFSGDLTNSFRKKEQSVLSFQTKLRDKTLILKATYTESNTQIEGTPKFSESINSYLSNVQLELLDRLEIAEGYKLVENDFNDLKIPPNQIQRNLDLFTEIGMIKSVNIAIAPGEIGNVFYTPAYRSLAEEDNTKQSDLENLEIESNI